MRRVRIGALAIGAVAIVGMAFANGSRQWSARLLGINEVPAVSTTGNGGFRAEISHDESSVTWELSYDALEGAVTQAHIHVGQPAANGGVSVWLCSNLTSPPTPAGVQPCPAPPATIGGTFTAADVVGPSAQGIAPGEFAELLASIRAARTYANVHTTKFPGGEARGRLNPGRGHAH